MSVFHGLVSFVAKLGSRKRSQVAINIFGIESQLAWAQKSAIATWSVERD
jgi:hypothetical protein